MATCKIWSVKTSLGSKLSYIGNEKKTMSEDISSFFFDEGKLISQDNRYIVGINCDARNAFSEMVKTKEEFNKLNGVQAYHGYVSFGSKDKLDPLEVLQATKEIANRMWGERFQVVLACHTNTDILHCHFVCNSVSFVDGKKLANNEKNYYNLRRVVDEVCKERNLSVTKPYSRSKVNPSEVYEAVLEAKQKTNNSEDFIEFLKQREIKVLYDNTVRSKDGKIHHLNSVSKSLMFSVKDVNFKEDKDNDKDFATNKRTKREEVFREIKRNKREREPSLASRGM